MVIGFCGAIEFMMMWMNANDGGPLEESIHASKLTVATYYVMLIFSLSKCIAGYVIQRSFRQEYMLAYGDESGAGGDYDLFHNDSEVNRNNQQGYN